MAWHGGHPSTEPNSGRGPSMMSLSVLYHLQAELSARRRRPAAPWWTRHPLRAPRTATVLLASVALVMPWAAGPAQAALLDRHLVGVDVSYPQCGGPLPTGQAFAIVGVNGGSAATT